MNLREVIITEVCKCLKKAILLRFSRLLLCGFCRLVPFFAYGRTANLKAVIYLDGEKYAEYTLAKYEKPISVTVDGTGRNIVEISKNGVRVTESDCADKLEINGGTINKEGQSLICLPNRFLVKIEGGGDEIDAVTY